MATKINVGIDVSDNGSTDKVTKKVKNLHSVLKDTQAAAAGIAVGGGTAGGTAGSRGLAAAARPGVAAAAEVVDYGRMRGAAGATGASARDFANQSQGLGGLVRLYATFAANVFAVSAAFGALREAMNTTNMIRGLDMLGAASGQNLGSLSKQLVDVTNGALSMRDAMESVAKATSSGMGQKDLLRLTEVAKNASSVLGLNLPDSMSRLTRAVTKLEPELLDELGIMTRIEPAVEAYARQVGKSASQLSQMERQQAFLNAVLAEGEQKFGALGAAVTNPYDQLLASLKNVLQTGLEFINNFLAPVVSLLASSPTGLALVLGAIGTSLVRQALPALTQFKAGLARTAEEAKNIAIQRAQDAAAATEKINQISLRSSEARAEAEVARVDAAEKRIQDLRQGTLNKNTAAYKLLQKTAQEVTDAELANVRKRADVAERRGLLDKAAAYREVANAQESSRAAEAAYAQKEREVREERKRSLFYQQTQRAEIAAQEKATKSAIVSNAAYNVGLIGLTGSWRLMNEQIKESGLQLGRFERGALQARAAFAILGGAVGALGTALNAALGWIGLAVSVVGILDSVLSKGSKQVSEFNSAIDSLESNAEATARTIQRLNNTSGTGTIQGITAISNSLRELGDSAEDALQKMLRAQTSMSGWEKFKNAIASIFGGGLENNLADSIAKSIENALASLAGLPMAETARTKFSELLGTQDLSIKGVEEAFKRLNETGKKAVTSFIKELGTLTTESANRLNTFKNSVEATTKSYQQFIQSTAFSDPLFTLGNNLQDVGTAMSNLQTKGIRELDAALIEFAKDPSKAQLFGPEFVRGIIGIRDELLETTNSFNQYNVKLQELDTQEQKIIEQRSERRKKNARANVSDLNLQLASISESRTQIQESLLNLNLDSVKEARDLFNTALEGVFQRSAKLVEQALGNAAEKAKLTLEKARIELLSGPRRVEEEIRLQRQEIDTRLRAIDVNIDLILASEKLSAELALSNAINQRARAEREGKGVEEAADREQIARITADTITAASKGQIPDLIRALDTLVKEGKATGISESGLKQVRLNLTGAARQIAAQQATRTGVQAEGKVIDLTAPLRQQKALNEEAEKFRRLNDEILQAELGLVSSINSIAGETTQIGVELQNQAATRALNTKLQQEDNRLAEERARIAAAGNNAEDIAKFNTQQTLIQEKQRLETLNQIQQNRQRTLTFELQLQAKVAELERARQGLAFSRQQLELDAIGEQNQAYSSLYGTVNSFVLVQQDQLARQQAQLQLTKEQAAITASLQEKQAQADAQKRATVDPQSEQGIQAIAAIEERIERERRLADVAIQGLQDQYNQRIRILNVAQQVNLEQERYNSLLQTSTGFAESLTSAFQGAADSVKGIADALGNVVTKTAEFGITSEKNQKALLQADDAIIKKKAEIQAIEESGDDAGPRIRELTKLEEGRAAQAKKSARDEITGAAQIAGASKKLFKEKTVAYKLLAATEKVLHITRLAMDAKELAIKLGFISASTTAKAAGEAKETAIAGAGFLSRVGLYISEIFAKFTAMLGPFGPPLAAVTIAALGLGAVGAATRTRAPNIQEDTGAGTVVGDRSAQSKSLENSLERLQSVNVVTMKYSGEMVKHLRSIDSSIGQLGVAISKSLGVEGDIAAGVFGMENQKFAAYTGLTSIDKALTNFIGKIPVIGNLINKVVSFIAGSSETIVNQGIQITQQNLGQILDEGFSAKFYADVRKQTELFKFIKVRDTVDTSLQDIDKDLALQFTRIFEGIAGSLSNAAQIFGMSQAEAQQILEGYTIDTTRISTQGLSQAEISEKLRAVLSKQADLIAKRLLPGYEDFIRTGEGAYDTTIRVALGIEEAKTKLQLLGIQAINYTDILDKQADVGAELIRQSLLQQESQEFIREIIQNAESSGDVIVDLYTELDTLRDSFAALGIQQNLLNRDTIIFSGGLDKLSSNVENVLDRFRTREEKLAASGQKVSETFAKFGISIEGVATAQEFITLLQSATSPELLAALLNIESAFKDLIDSAEETNSKIIDEQERLNRRILELQGETVKIRELELQAIAESNRVLQLRIWALEDLKATEQSLIAAQDKVKQIQDRATDAYIQASQKVADAQQNIADQAIEAAKRMRDLGKGLREFVQAQLGIGSNQTASSLQQFRQATQFALQGDSQSQQNIQQLAEAAIESARQSSRSAREFEATRREILSSTLAVANFAEQQASLVTIPEEDPQKQAQKALEDALVVQQESLIIAQATSAALVKLPENLVEQYTVAKQQLDEAILARISAEDAANKLQLTFTAISTDIRNLLNVNAAGFSSIADRIKTSQPINSGYGFDLAGPVSPWVAAYNKYVPTLGGAEAARLANLEEAQRKLSIGGSLPLYGMGGMFLKGAMRYAQGGMFTNQIVDRPTAFDLGVMGEAGPEAILPLTRIGGMLGVRAEVPQFAQPQQSNAQLLQEVIKLRKEVENLRVEARVTAVSSNKTYRLFERITTDGEALNVVTVS